VRKKRKNYTLCACKGNVKLLHLSFGFSDSLKTEKIRKNDDLHLHRKITLGAVSLRLQVTVYLPYKFVHQLIEMLWLHIIPSRQDGTINLGDAAKFKVFYSKERPTFKIQSGKKTDGDMAAVEFSRP